MRTIIAGSREGANINHIYDAVEKSGITPTVVISGTARGVDRLGEEWAKDNSVPIERYPADWDKYGKKAGYLRNSQMAEIAEALIAIWDGISPGTENMISLATKKKIFVYVYRIPNKYQRDAESYYNPTLEDFLE